jgi:glyoxylate reductase
VHGAGLDVYAHEPAIHPRLLRADNVVLLPHLGSATEEARVGMGRRALENLRAFFGGEPPPDAVLAR